MPICGDSWSSTLSRSRNASACCFAAAISVGSLRPHVPYVEACKIGRTDASCRIIVRLSSPIRRIRSASLSRFIACERRELPQKRRDYDKGICVWNLSSASTTARVVRMSNASAQSHSHCHKGGCEHVCSHPRRWVEEAFDRVTWVAGASSVDVVSGAILRPNRR
jgi:hypothetical protein